LPRPAAADRAALPEGPGRSAGAGVLVDHAGTMLAGHQEPAGAAARGRDAPLGPGHEAKRDRRCPQHGRENGERPPVPGAAQAARAVRRGLPVRRWQPGRSVVMRASGRQQPGSHEDARLSQLYQQVTDMQAPRFGADYDVEKGLERYRAWLSEHGAAPEPATEPLAAAELLSPDAFGVSGTMRAEWSADRAVIELYSQHYRALVRLAALLVRDTPTAEEVVQDSFVAMQDGWQRLRDTEKALAYLRQAVVNRSRSVLRHRTVVDKNLQKAPPDMPSAEHGALVLLERSAVVAALRGLPDRQREAIVLRYYADLSEAEIATAMGISRGAVKSHTARGMTALRAALEQE